MGLGIMINSRTTFRMMWAAIFAAGFCSWCVGAAVFVQDGQLVMVEENAVAGKTTRSGDDPVPAVRVAPEGRVAAYWGRLDDDRLLVTLESHAARSGTEEVDPHCSTESPGKPAVIMGPDGTLGASIYSDVLRAYPAPVGQRVAVISPERDLLLWQNDVCTTVSAPGKVSNAGWSPDGRHLVVSVYPPDWSEGAVSTASTTEDFLRLQNANLHLFDVEKGEFVTQLTDDPGTEYGAFFSPDGKSLYYHWLHLTEDKGGLMRMDLDLDDNTSASAPAVQLTKAGNDPGETPLGRVTTYVWTPGGRDLVFEAGRPDGSGEIWTVKPDGTSSEFRAAGRKPQLVGNQSVVFMGANGAPEIIQPEVIR